MIAVDHLDLTPKPRRTERVSLPLAAAERAALRAQAEERGVTVAALLRAACRACGLFAAVPDGETRVP